MSKLNNIQKRDLQKASRVAISDEFISLQPFFKRKKWLQKSNVYITAASIYKKLDSLPHNNSHLNKYIAASGPLHSMDGWGFLGRSLDSLIKGDSNIAIHLGYYAELRATMALMATEGIGIFKRKHIIVEKVSWVYELRGHTTHQIAWLALEHWSGLRRSADLLGKIISPDGISLNDWLKEFSSSADLFPIGKKWFQSWGLDLKQLGRDQDLRNEASYRPSRIKSSESIEFLEYSTFLANFWSLFEPDAKIGFKRLDSHLLRLSLEEAYEGFSGKSPKSDPHRFKQRIENMLDKLFPTSEAIRLEWTKFLIREIDPETPFLIECANEKPSEGKSRMHLQVLSRAALMLRISSGASSRLIQGSGINKSLIKFWWDSIGKDRGMWDDGDDPIEFNDLWADIEIALNDFQMWIRQNGSAANFYLLQRDRLKEIFALGSCERIGLWGLGI